jgi:hypothetical protein
MLAIGTTVNAEPAPKPAASTGRESTAIREPFQGVTD